MEAKVKERLYRLVDRIPEGEVHAAERYLEYLAEHGDPFIRVIMNAPEVDESLSEEDRDALEEGRRALEAGDVVTDEELRAELVAVFSADPALDPGEVTKSELCCAGLHLWVTTIIQHVDGEIPVPLEFGGGGQRPIDRGERLTTDGDEDIHRTGNR